MQTYFWLALSLLGLISISVGVFLFVRNLPKTMNSSKNSAPKFKKARETGKDANEQIQDLLRDFEEKWRNRQ